jgi:hypothetical protein
MTNRLLPLASLFVLVAGAVPAWGAELVVVNNACTETALSKDVLKSLYSGRKRSLPGGQRVEVLTVDGAVHEHFVSDLLDSTPAQFTTYWQRLVFIGQGKMPRSFASEKDLLAYIAATPGALGYIDAATPHDGVKVLTIGE